MDDDDNGEKCILYFGKGPTDGLDDDTIQQRLNILLILLHQGGKHV